VEDITWSNTLIKDLSNTPIVVPNSRIASIFKNFYLPDSETWVGISPVISVEAELEKVERLCVGLGKEAVDEFSGVVKTFEPVVRFSSFSDWGLIVNVFFLGL